MNVSDIERHVNAAHHQLKLIGAAVKEIDKLTDHESRDLKIELTALLASAIKVSDHLDAIANQCEIA